MTVLLVENEVLARMVLAEYLRECGYVVIEAVDGQEALIVLRDGERQVDIVLTDVEATGVEGGGFGLSRWVRQNRPAIPVMMAASAEQAAKLAAGLCDSGPLLSKPYDPQAVVDRIKWLLGSQRSSAPAINCDVARV